MAHHEVDVDAMLGRIELRQFYEWRNFAALIGPIGIQRTDWQFAKVLALIYNRSRSKGQRAIDAREFMPDWHPITFTERMKRSMARMKAWKFQRSPAARKRREQARRKKGAES